MLTDVQIIAKYGQPGIYNLFWDGQGYYYIGQAKSLKSRKAVHFSSLKKGTHDNPKLQNIYNKYGLPDFEVLEECNIERLQNREQLYLEFHFDDKMNCNLLPSAKSSIGYKHTPETKLLFKERMANPEARKFLSEINKGHKRNVGLKHSEETKLKMSISGKGKKKTEKQLSAFKEWASKLKGENHPLYGKKFSKEHRDKITKSRIGALNGNFGKVAINAIAVIDLATNKVYPSVKKCALEIGIDYSHLKKVLAGKIVNKTSIVYA